jgi:hypothetical protein
VTSTLLLLYSNLCCLSCYSLSEIDLEETKESLLVY